MSTSYDTRYGIARKKHTKKNDSERVTSRKFRAEMRKRDYDTLSTEEKLTRAQNARGNSKKQIEKLQYQLAMELAIMNENTEKKEKKNNSKSK